MDTIGLIAPLVTAAIFLLVYIRDRSRVEGNWEEKFKHTVTRSGVREMLAQYVNKESHEQICQKERALQEVRNERLENKIVAAIHEVEARLLKAIKQNGKQ